MERCTQLLEATAATTSTPTFRSQKASVVWSPPPPPQWPHCPGTPSELLNCFQGCRGLASCLFPSPLPQSLRSRTVFPPFYGPAINNCALPCLVPTHGQLSLSGSHPISPSPGPIFSYQPQRIITSSWKLPQCPLLQPTMGHPSLGSSIISQTVGSLRARAVSVPTPRSTQSRTGPCTGERMPWRSQPAAGADHTARQTPPMAVTSNQ